MFFDEMTWNHFFAWILNQPRFSTSLKTEVATKVFAKKLYF
jgi:hypothetical protein